MFWNALKTDTKHEIFLNSTPTLYFPYILPIFWRLDLTLLALLSSTLSSFFFNRTRRIALTIKRFYISLHHFLFHKFFFFLLCTCFFVFSFCAFFRTCSFFLLCFISLFFFKLAANNSLPIPIQINALPLHLVFEFCYKSELEGQVKKSI